MPYEVRTPVYEGPFDLLLHLIAREQVELWEISLADIVDAYLEEVQRMPQVDLEIATEFLLIAATLVELKTRRLLPGAGDGDLEEEIALYERRDLLLARLLEYKTFKDTAAALAALARRAGLGVPRTLGPEEPFASLTPDPLDRLTVRQLHAAAVRVLVPRPAPVVDLDHVAPVRASVRDAIETVLALLPSRGTMTFRDIAVGAGSRLEVIVRFLAVLELFKRGVVDLEQTATFGDLHIAALDTTQADNRLAVDLDWDDDTPATPGGDRTYPADTSEGT